VDLPVVAKAVNEVYKSFNTNQLPLVVLDFTVPRGMSRNVSVTDGQRALTSMLVRTNGRYSCIAKLS